MEGLIVETFLVGMRTIELDVVHDFHLCRLF
jgi:hypothetical protein